MAVGLAFTRILIAAPEINYHALPCTAVVASRSRSSRRVVAKPVHSKMGSFCPTNKSDGIHLSSRGMAFNPLQTTSCACTLLLSSSSRFRFFRVCFLRGSSFG